MSNIISLSDLKKMNIGHAWMEIRPDPEDSPSIPPEDYLQEIIWMDDDLMLRDVYGIVSTGHWHDECDDTYGTEWRVWNEKPSAERMKEAAWNVA